MVGDLFAFIVLSQSLIIPFSIDLPKTTLEKSYRGQFMIRNLPENNKIHDIKYILNFSFSEVAKKLNFNGMHNFAENIKNSFESTKEFTGHEKELWSEDFR